MQKVPNSSNVECKIGLLFDDVSMCMFYLYHTTTFSVLMLITTSDISREFLEQEYDSDVPITHVSRQSWISDSASSPCCPTVSQSEYTPQWVTLGLHLLASPSTRGSRENMMSSTKPEVHNVLQLCQGELSHGHWQKYRKFNEVCPCGS